MSAHEANITQSIYEKTSFMTGWAQYEALRRICRILSAAGATGHHQNVVSFAGLDPIRPCKRCFAGHPKNQTKEQYRILLQQLLEAIADPRQSGFEDCERLRHILENRRKGIGHMWRFSKLRNPNARR